MELVNCTKKYWNFVRTLRNDQRVTSGFIKSVHITEEMQIKYMECNSHCYWICLLDGEPVGYVGVIEGDIRVCTHPDYQGIGIGRFMIKEVMNKKPTAFAKVKTDNEASVKLFEACGFTKKFYILTKD
jgi:ribosomal protein S18 acetylase RimI-like enzyme